MNCDGSESGEGEVFVFSEGEDDADMDVVDDMAGNSSDHPMECAVPNPQV